MIRYVASKICDDHGYFYNKIKFSLIYGGLNQIYLFKLFEKWKTMNFLPKENLCLRS